MAQDGSRLTSVPSQTCQRAVPALLSGKTCCISVDLSKRLRLVGVEDLGCTPAAMTDDQRAHPKQRSFALDGGCVARRASLMRIGIMLRRCGPPLSCSSGQQSCQTSATSATCQAVTESTCGPGCFGAPSTLRCLLAQWPGRPLGAKAKHRQPRSGAYTTCRNAVAITVCHSRAKTVPVSLGRGCS